jgi:hypothetical protein
MPSGSLTATPIRRLPMSSPSARIRLYSIPACQAPSR